MVYKGTNNLQVIGISKMSAHQSSANIWKVWYLCKLQ